MQGVVDGTLAAARRKNYRQLELYHHVEHELFAINGNEDSACSFDDEPIVHEAGGQIDAREIDFHPGPARSKIGRYGRNKFVDFIESAIRPDAGKAHNGYTIGSFKRSRLNRFPVNGVESRAQQSGQSRFANTGVGTSDEKVSSHACLDTTVECW